jgi:hypothetical protein
MTQLRDDLFGPVLLPGHSNVQYGSIAYFTEDHFSGGRPLDGAGGLFASNSKQPADRRHSGPFWFGDMGAKGCPWR